jgi:ACS family sodium-dependent inorganic phosphate cotransporter
MFGQRAISMLWRRSVVRLILLVNFSIQAADSYIPISISTSSSSSSLLPNSLSSSSQGKSAVDPTSFPFSPNRICYHCSKVTPKYNPTNLFSIHPRKEPGVSSTTTKVADRRLPITTSAPSAATTTTTGPPVLPTTKLDKNNSNENKILFEPDFYPLISPTYNDFDNTRVVFMMVLLFTVGSLSSLDRVAMSVALVPMSEEMVMSDSVKGSISSFFSIGRLVTGRRRATSTGFYSCMCKRIRCQVAYTFFVCVCSSLPIFACVGYGIGIVPAGLLLAKLSPTAIMATGIFLWSLGTMATPYAASQGSMGVLLGARALVGASESCVIPSIQLLLSNWVVPEKKSLALAFVFCGFQTGTILAYSLSPILIDQSGDWRSIFYIYGGAGLLFLVPFVILARDSPTALVATGRVQEGTQKGELYETDTSDDAPILDSAKAILSSAPWRQFATSKATWAMFLAHAASNWGLYINLSWTPTFYAEQYGLDVKESALLLVVPSIAGAIGGLSAGSAADAVIKNLEVQSDQAITQVRRTFQGLALFGPAVCMSLLSSIPEQPWVAQVLFAVSVSMQSFNSAGYGAANQEKAGPKWTGLLYSVTSLPSVMFGTVGVYLTGRILDATNQDWSSIFALNAVVYALGATAFVVLYDSRREFD